MPIDRRKQYYINKYGNLDRYNSIIEEESLILDGKFRCKKCGEIKPLYLFSIASNSRSGRRTVCKSCLSKKYDEKSDRYQIIEENKQLEDLGWKKCVNCRNIKTLDYFPAGSLVCKQCTNTLKSYYSSPIKLKFSNTNVSTTVLLKNWLKRLNIKQCSKCNEYKVVNEFSKSICVECNKEYTKEYYNKFSKKKKLRSREEHKEYYLDLTYRTWLKRLNLKKCNKCGEIKFLNEFSKKSYGKCKKCFNEEQRIKRKNIRDAKEKEILDLYTEGYLKCRKCGEICRIEDFGKDKRYRFGIEETCKWCRNENRKKYRNTKEGKIFNRMSTGIRRSLKGKKDGKWLELVDYTLDELIKNMESKFGDEYSWDNIDEWHIDHIKPVSSFDLSDPDQFRECWSLDNLQPLWAKDNLIKGNSYN